MAMTKRKIKLEDGRYLIYYEFGSEPTTRSGRSLSRPGSVVAGPLSRPCPRRRSDTTDHPANTGGAR